MENNRKDFDKEAGSWDEKPERIKLVNEIADAISEDIILAPDMDVLDFGCGTGLLTLRLQPSVRSVTGVDSSQGMLDVLRMKIDRQGLTNVKIKRLDLEEGDTLDGTYDLVASSMTLHHIKDTGALLAQLEKVTAPGGTLCIADLDPDDGHFHGDNVGVFHFGFDREKLREAFAQAGFEDVRDRSVAAISKPTRDGETRSFSVFLMIGRKKG